MAKFRIIDRAYGGYHRHPDPDDSWDRGEEYTCHDIRGVCLIDDDAERRPWFDLETEVDVKVGDDVWLVYALYSTGSTFGRADGRIMYIDIFTDAEEAFQLKRDLDADARADFEAWRNDFNERHKKKKKDRYEQKMTLNYTHNGVEKEVWVGTWKGYFERLQEIEVERVTVYPHDYEIPSRW